MGGWGGGGGWGGVECNGETKNMADRAPIPINIVQACLKIADIIGATNFPLNLT